MLVVHVLLSRSVLGMLLLQWLNTWSRALASEPGLGGDCKNIGDEQRSWCPVGLGSL